MANTFNTPGIYVEEVSTFPPSIQPTETAVPIFIGATSKALDFEGSTLLNKPTRINSMLEFTENFGEGFSEHEAIVVEVRDTVDEGIARDKASRLLSVHVDEPKLRNLNMHYALQMFFNNGGNSCYVLSINDGSGTYTPQDLIAGVDLSEKVDDPSLLVFPDAFTTAEYKSVYDYALASCSMLRDRFALLDIWDETTDPISDADRFRAFGLGGSNLSYGAAYYPKLKTHLQLFYDEAKLKVKHFKTDTSHNTLSTGLAHGRSLLELRSADPSLYLDLKQEIAEHTTVCMTPSSSIAGIYSRVDKVRGVWKSPANEILHHVVEPTVELSSMHQEYLNQDVITGKSINGIRSFTGRGVLVWGARTLSGNDNEWRYVSAKRLCMFVEESIKKGTSFAVFEPNQKKTWLQVKAMIESFLFDLWRQGALIGTKPEEAFYVSIGLGTTMTQTDIREGIMNMEVGLAAVRPAEFIIIRISHTLPRP